MRWTVLFGVGILGLAFLVGTSDGQGGGEPKKTKGGKMTGMLPPGYKELKLSPTQTEKIYEIQSKYKAKLDALEEQGKALRAELTAERFKVLTAEQKEAYQKNLTGETPRKSSDDKK